MAAALKSFSTWHEWKINYSKNLKRFSFLQLTYFERDSDSWQPPKKMKRLPEVLSSTGISLLIYFYFYFFEPSFTPSLPRFSGSCIRRRGQPAIVQITLSALAFERAPARTSSRFISPGWDGYCFGELRLTWLLWHKETSVFKGELDCFSTSKRHWTLVLYATPVQSMCFLTAAISCH